MNSMRETSPEKWYNEGYQIKENHYLEYKKIKKNE